MFQLVYISTAREPISTVMLDEILASSRRNNDRDGITGLLVAGARRFLQALEGPEQAVWDAYSRIRGDARHHAFVLLTGRAVEERAFGSWSMACERGRDDGGDESLVETVRRLTQDLSDATLRAHFVGFAELQGRSA